MTELQSAIVNQLRSNGDQTVRQLARALGSSVNETENALYSLEMAQMVRSVGAGAHFRAVVHEDYRRPESN